jgi:putative endonuclease
MIVAAVYMAFGHRILGRRFKTPVGEIDLIAIKGRRVAFIEVKRRATIEDAEDAITLTMRRRVRRAADLWLAHNPRYQGYDVGFDLVFVVPWRFPIVMRDAL